MSAFTGELVISGEKVRFRHHCTVICAYFYPAAARCAQVATVSVPVSGTLSATIVAAKAAVMVVINEQLEKAGASAEADKGEPKGASRHLTTVEATPPHRSLTPTRTAAGDVYEDAADEDVPEAKPQPPKRQKKEKGGK